MRSHYTVITLSVVAFMLGVTCESPADQREYRCADNPPSGIQSYSVGDTLSGYGCIETDNDGPFLVVDVGGDSVSFGLHKPTNDSYYGAYALPQLLREPGTPVQFEGVAMEILPNVFLAHYPLEVISIEHTFSD